MYYVGIDWADSSHRVCVLNEDAQVATEFDMNHSQSGFRSLASELGKLAKAPGQIAVICETRHNLLINFLGRRDYPLYVINPKALDRFRDTKRASSSKSDRFDAYCLADFLKTNIETLRPLEKDDESVRRAGACFVFAHGW